MASAQGNAEIDFGSSGATMAEVAVTGQASISSGSSVEAFFMAEASTENIAGNHVVASALVRLICGTIVAGTGFTINATADQRMYGKYKVRWVWSD